MPKKDVDDIPNGQSETRQANESGCCPDENDLIPRQTDGCDQLCEDVDLETFGYACCEGVREFTYVRRLSEIGHVEREQVASCSDADGLSRVFDGQGQWLAVGQSKAEMLERRSHVR